MAEAAATALGVIGFLGQLFDGCVRAYGYFTTAARLDQDSARLVCKVRIEEMRLVVWGREWGVAEGRLERESTPQMAALAGRIMEELHATVTDFVKLRDRYGIVEEAAAQNGQAKGAKEARERDGGRERGWRKELTLRAKWVIADKEKFTALLRDLKDFNDGLDQLFPPSRLPSLHRAWRHSLLDHAQRDVAELALLASSAEDSYPQLRASAALKKLRINLDLTPQAQFRPTFAFRVARADLTLDANPSTHGGGPPRSTPGHDPRVAARHSAHGPVLVEWVEYDREDPDERFLHLRRLDDLARMLRSASARHPDLHTPDCVGYVDDAPAHPRYGLVYKLPPCPSPTPSDAASLAAEPPADTPADADAATPAHTSLHALIAGPLRTPDLTARIDLARTLAVALWSLHSLDWLHKSLCSANILFIRPAAPSSSSSSSSSSQKDAASSAAQVPCIEAPHLVGFDASRPDLDPEMSVNPRNPSIVNLYRDPRVSSFGSGSHGGGGSSHEKNSNSHERDNGGPRQPYRKSHDIYSLGLVLLEIGWWKVLSTYYKPHYSAERWRDKVVLPVLVPGLASKTGRLYRDVVERCLTVHEDMSSSEAGEVMEWVVATLESIRT
ncbi:hypothetical protein ACHAQF_007745 [Verticillium nonalfalfae]